MCFCIKSSIGVKLASCKSALNPPGGFYVIALNALTELGAFMRTECISVLSSIGTQGEVG